MFYVEPPESQDVQAWEAWMDREKKAETVQKRKATMALEHGDIDDELGHLGLGFAGDWANGEGEIVAVVSYRHNVGKRRGRRGGKRRSRRASKL